MKVLGSHGTIICPEWMRTNSRHSSFESQVVTWRMWTSHQPSLSQRFPKKNSPTSARCVFLGEEFFFREDAGFVWHVGPQTFKKGKRDAPPYILSLVSFALQPFEMKR